MYQIVSADFLFTRLTSLGLFLVSKLEKLFIASNRVAGFVLSFKIDVTKFVVFSLLSANFRPPFFYQKIITDDLLILNIGTNGHIVREVPERA